MLHTLFYLSLCSLCLCLSICLSVCLSVSFSLPHSLTLCFSILCIGLSLWVYVRAQGRPVNMFCMFLFLSTIWNLGVGVLAWGFTCLTVSRWGGSWGLVVPTLNSIALWLCGHKCSYICIYWADYKSVVISGLISRIMCNICLYSIRYPGFRIPFMKTGETPSQVSGGQRPVA